MSLFPAPHETIEGVGRALRTGQTSCVEVLKKCLDRIAEWEGRVKAWVVVDREGAFQQAEQLDQELSEGKCRGPLHGIPFGIKDIIDVESLPTAAGFRPWRNRIASKDACVVKILRGNGAVILGKTVTTQFAWIDPPPTRNPWNLERTPGGSSSGSAVAVALGMCLGALGTQTGGSVIRPAAFCGVAAYKPWWSCDPVRHGIIPLAKSFDTVGVLARTVRDLYLLRRMVSWIEEDLDDLVRAIPDDDHPDHLPRLEIPPRLIRPRGFFDRRAEPVALAAFDHSLDALRHARAEIVDVDDADFNFEAILTSHRTIMAAEAAAEHEDRLADHPDDYAPHIRSLIEEGHAVPASRYIRLREEWYVHQQAFRRISDAVGTVVTPSTVGPAPDVSTTGNPCFQSPFTYLHWPTITFPTGLSPDGLPLGIQFVGIPSQSYDPHPRDLFETAAWSETVIRNAARAGSLES